MPHVPAVCDNCGAVFPSGFFIGGDAIDTTFAGNTSGPCPNCGSTGHTPDGTFNFTEDTIQLLQGPQRTVFELERLAEILREANQRNANFEEVRLIIEQKTPEFAMLANLLPRTRSELYAFIAIILTIIQILLDTANTQGTNIRDIDIDIEQVINITIQQQSPPDP